MEKRREYDREYKKNHPEMVRKQQQRYREKHADEIKRKRDAKKLEKN